jgi:hypothetical protein
VSRLTADKSFLGQHLEGLPDRVPAGVETPDKRIFLELLSKVEQT